MICCFLWADGEEIEPIDFPEAPVVGDIISIQADNEFLRVTSRQWDITTTAKPALHVHTTPAEPE